MTTITKINYKCPFCRVGFMLTTPEPVPPSTASTINMTITFNQLPGYRHRCSSCDKSMQLDTPYPITTETYWNAIN